MTWQPPAVVTAAESAAVLSRSTSPTCEPLGDCDCDRVAVGDGVRVCVPVWLGVSVDDWLAVPACEEDCVGDDVPDGVVVGDGDTEAV